MRKKHPFDMPLQKQPPNDLAFKIRALKVSYTLPSRRKINFY